MSRAELSKARPKMPFSVIITGGIVSIAAAFRLAKTGNKGEDNREWTHTLPSTALAVVLFRL